MTDHKNLLVGSPYTIGARGVYAICKALTDAHGEDVSKTFRDEFFKWARVPQAYKDCPVIHVVGAVMVRDGRGFAARRATHKADAGVWEFPGGKVEADEHPKEALARELREELGVEVEVGAWVARGVGQGESATIQLDLYFARCVVGDIALTDHDASGWFDAAELRDLKWAAADRAALPQVLATLRILGAIHE
jgi:8-oxo-dGTP diphosphatase